MAFKRCTRIVYNTLAEDFDDLEEFLDGVSVDLFVVWRRFTKTSRLFQSTDGDYSSTRVFPGVPFDSESSKENQSKVPSLSTYQDVKTFENKRTGMV